ncbi:hypothetical protein LTR05_003719 [Lithohypha guttulata]|uniref:Uncharacterized protein n=1 Tax=Lithohypha guttulata TaxID=1690604 RepID=A0AAN7YGZ8_9EURO|nr:hypothetical protein LTR05_003719 [Lithohypha guttulata]
MTFPSNYSHASSHKSNASRVAVNPPQPSPTLLSLTSRPLPPLPLGEGEEVMAANNSSAFPPLDNPTSPIGRASIPGSQVNGNGNNYANNYIPPLPVGHQQDLAFLYQQIQELSGILQNNRERVNDVTRSAEEVARRANMANGHSSEDSSANLAKIRELERELAKSNKIIELYKHEQKENTALIGQYEQGLWQATDQIRDYTNKSEDRFIAQREHYNDLLQQEKDEHLQTRLERDHWQQQTLRVCEMIRKAYRLRVDEWCDEYRTVVGLQSEVRCYRRVLGMPPEKPEEETGWPYLKDAPFDDQDGNTR